MRYGYRKHKQRLRWLPWMLSLGIPLLLLFSIFGEGGIIHNYLLDLKLGKISEATKLLEQENIRQTQIIMRVRTDPEYATLMAARIAYVAPKNAVIYRFPVEKDPFLSIGEKLETIDKENRERFLFAHFLGDLWTD